MQVELKTLADLQDLLVKLVREGSTQDPGFIVTPDTDPTNEIAGFDSLNILEVLTEFEEETGLHFEDDIFYVDLPSKETRNISQIAKAIWAEIQKGG